MNENTKTSMENAIGEIKVCQNEKIPFEIFDKTDKTFAFLYMALGYAFIRCFIYFHLSFPLYTIAYIFTVILYAKRKNITLPKEIYFWAGVMMCVAFTFKTDNFSKLFIQIFIAAYFTLMASGGMCGGTSAYIVNDVLQSLILLPFSHFFAIFSAVFQALKPIGKVKKYTVSPAMKGAVMSAPALCIVIPLLIKADSNFLSGMSVFISNIIRNIRVHSIGVMILQILISLPVSCYMYSLSWGSVNKKYSFEKAVQARDKLRISKSVTINVFLYIVCAVYVMFIILQADYLLGAFTGKLYGTMTYAQYARSGFFELCQVSAINLSFLALCNLLLIENDTEKTKKPMVLLCALSIVLISTAMAKMIMYMSAYGLTEKRIIGSVFLVWLSVVFILCILRLNRSFNITKLSVVIGAVMVCILFSFNISLHCNNFNEKYGFYEKNAVEYEQSANQLP